MIIIIVIGEILTKCWGTSLLASADMFGAMVAVPLPDGVLGLSGDNMNLDDAETVQNLLHRKYNIEVNTCTCTCTICTYYYVYIIVYTCTAHSSSHACGEGIF